MGRDEYDTSLSQAVFLLVTVFGISILIVFYIIEWLETPLAKEEYEIDRTGMVIPVHVSGTTVFKLESYYSLDSIGDWLEFSTEVSGRKTDNQLFELVQEFWYEKGYEAGEYWIIKKKTVANTFVLQKGEYDFEFSYDFNGKKIQGPIKVKLYTMRGEPIMLRYFFYLLIGIEVFIVFLAILINSDNSSK